MVVAATWLGCSVEKNYELLSFFFDGVPDPNAPELDQVRGRRGGPRISVTSHAPYRERLCKECHVGASDFGMTFAGFENVDRDVCLKCHEGETTAYRKMHGPVAAGDCLWCHRPHESRYAHLLRLDGPDLCADCHDPGLLSPATPGHVEPERSCLDCHHGHGGDTAYFLRPAPAPAEPGPDEPAPPEPAMETTGRAPSEPAEDGAP
jgi:predicted CXXCH cytochrome family protein